MMMKNITKVFLLGFLIACTSARITNPSGDHNLIIEINNGNKIKKAEIIVFKIRNISAADMFILKPTIAYIEKLQEGIWKKIRILYCPCDAPCQAPIEKEILSSQNQIELSWDQQESWCDSKTGAQIRNSIYKAVEKGRYRIRIVYEIKKREYITVYKEFRIL